MAILFPEADLSKRASPSERRMAKVPASGNVAWRAGGAAMLLGASMGGFAIGPLTRATSLSELAVGFAGFCVACFGVLFLARGRALHDAWRAELNRRAGNLPTVEPQPEDLRPLLEWDAALCGRAPLATYLILRARQTASERHETPSRLHKENF